MGTIAIDFDGTLTSHAFPEIGYDIGAVPVVKRLIECGYQIVLFTMRSDVTSPVSEDPDIIPVGGQYLTEAVNWCTENGIKLYGINTNPTQASWTHSPKAYAHLYIDDASLGCPLLYPKNGGKPYADWKKIEILLEKQGFLPAKVTQTKPKVKKKTKREVYNEDYSDEMTWEEYDEKYYSYCDRCDGWYEEQCICYAR